MNKYNRAVNFITNRKGIIKAKEFKDENISFFIINELIKNKIIERVNRGIYNKCEDFEDRYYILSQRCTKAIYSYNDALYLLNKTEVTPFRVDITLPKGYNAHRLLDNVNVHYVKKEYLYLGTIDVISPFGNTVKCYNLERTICDLVKSRNTGLDIEQINKIIRNAFLKKEIDFNKLMDYAKKLKCDKKIKVLTEVLY